MLIKSRTSWYDCRYFIMWTTKYCSDILEDNHQQSLKEVLNIIAERHDCHMNIIRIDSHSVYMTIEVNPNKRVTDAVKALKGGSTKMMYSRFPELREQTFRHALWSHRTLIETTGSDLSNHVEFMKREVRTFNGGRPRRDVM